MENSGFYTITLPLEKNLFDELSNSVSFEDVAKGRIGNHLVAISQKGIPIVRTTTLYTIPAHNFSALHHKIVESVNQTIQSDQTHQLPLLDFNNALIEVYDCHYATMKYHSDQCMDLESDSYIGLFTCYENPDKLTEKNVRKLKLKDKTTNQEFDITLTHNSMVLFSLSANTKYLHKIILESMPSIKKSESDNKWLGITFRKSKTFINFNDGVPRFATGEVLEVANDDQKAAFFKLRAEENTVTDFVYPRLSYTLSIGDTLTPKQ
ncbi:hypothetical protein SGQ44_12000 [Flavobacterium sp. Fl-77]|uniref:Alpha-ketoglutarate-dependent dioxygenase AlkB-like domain-containing protein n=1 Tax=Flavobacterium flavipigmentatum TaxID=2893884 RepID=A0AAJ2SI69_9FLAO|nr:MULTISPECIES: hypothetical protein [unclassified Flavobacterium]MDX6183035.1 hypothetical protein [Flavobacterium sp. Fl-33]MDX6186488.1 hypothetical protein [Flavobacterium sp. Fl-77]UFH37728.1 hypothetical protein LNP22_13400 [Flavobacterium sp. F-70]